jgi:signal peptidase II
VLLDQVAKVWAVAALTPGDPVPVVDGWLQLRLVRNPGAAFSFLTNGTWVFTVVATAVSVFILRTSRRAHHLGWAVALGLLLGGAVGNLVDRFVRSPGVGRGHVVDYIEFLRFPFMDFPVFNLADSCIVVSAFLIAGLGFAGIGLDGTKDGVGKPVDG